MSDVLIMYAIITVVALTGIFFTLRANRRRQHHGS